MKKIIFLFSHVILLFFSSELYAVNAEAWEKIFSLEVDCIWEGNLNNYQDNDKIFIEKAKRQFKDEQESFTSKCIKGEKIKEYFDCINYQKLAWAKSHIIHNDVIDADIFYIETKNLEYGIDKIKLIKRVFSDGSSVSATVFYPENNKIGFYDIINRYGVECSKIVSDQDFSKHIEYDIKGCKKYISHLPHYNFTKALFYFENGSLDTVHIVNVVDASKNKSKKNK
jgi:hypothetical protein